MTTRISLPNRKSVTFAVGGIFGLVGVMLLAIAAWTALSSHRLRRDGLRADGEVIELVRKRDSDADTTWAPVFRFATAEDQVTFRPTRPSWCASIRTIRAITPWTSASCRNAPVEGLKAAVIGATEPMTYHAAMPLPAAIGMVRSA